MGWVLHLKSPAATCREREPDPICKCNKPKIGKKRRKRSAQLINRKNTRHNWHALSLSLYEVIICSCTQKWIISLISLVPFLCCAGCAFIENIGRSSFYLLLFNWRKSIDDRIDFLMTPFDDGMITDRNGIGWIEAAVRLFRNDMMRTRSGFVYHWTHKRRATIRRRGWWWHQHNSWKRMNEALR